VLGFGQKKASRLLHSRIRRHVPTRPLHVMSLQDSFLVYYCVPRKMKRLPLSNPCRIFAIFSTPGPLLLQFTLPHLGLSFPGIEPMFDRCICFGLLFTLDDDLGRTFILPYGTILPAAPHYYWRSVRSQETVFQVVPFSKCTYACCRTFFVDNPLLPTLHKYWFLWTEFST